MSSLRLRPLVALTLALLLTAGAGLVAAEPLPSQSPQPVGQPLETDQPLPSDLDACGPAVRPDTALPQSYRDAAFVYISLGQTNQELGIRLLCDQPDGKTRAQAEGSGRMVQPHSAGAERFFYFDVDPTYISGGKNQVVMTISYRDVGLTPVYLEYDSFDPYRPDSRADAVAKKRIPLFTRTNSDATRSFKLSLDDARFSGYLPGGADFRIVSLDDLTVTAVSVMLVKHQTPPAVPKVILRGTEVQFNPDDVQPYIVPETGTTLVPFRAMFNALGIPDEAITWHGTTRQVEVRWAGKTILLTIGSKTALVNGQPIELKQEPTILGDRTVIPLRFVLEQFGLKVDWDNTNRVITLSAQQPEAQPGTQQPGTQPGTQQPGTQPGTQQPGAQQPGTTPSQPQPQPTP